MKRKPRNRVNVFGYLLAGSVVMSLMLSLAFAADEPPTTVFSASKTPPAGFSQLVEPNVLLLIDTSGSMTFAMDGDYTYGDGSNPYSFKNKQFYFGRDTDESNNVSSDDYHPGLGRYIHKDHLPENPGAYLDFVTSSETISKDNSVSPFKDGDYKLADGTFQVGYSYPSDGRLIKKGKWNNYNKVNYNDSKPTEPTDCEWRWDNDKKAWFLWVLNRRYLYPNDSRMYVLKNVLYRILSDTTLVGGLRLALSAYNQDYESSGTNSLWYVWPPTNTNYNNGSREVISWESQGDKARLHVGFASTTTSPDHLKTIRDWFDGKEGLEDGTMNYEFRAGAGTPLAKSIDNSTSENDSVIDFYKMEGTVTAREWCRDNWLVLLTDGGDNDFINDIWGQKDNVPNAVKKLYDLNFGITGARPVKTMVIGLVDPDDEEDLAKSLAKVADYGDDGEIDTGNYSPKTYSEWVWDRRWGWVLWDNTYEFVWNKPISDSKAYFATDLKSLMAAFKTIFQTIQDAAATGSAPLVNPPKTLGGAGKVYSAGFRPKNDQQWLGFLSSYTISGNVVSSTPEWEAGALLDSRDSGERSILTADWGTGSSSKVGDTNLKAFSSGNASALRAFVAGDLSITDTLLGKFFNWVRGADEWDEAGGDERWKLGDPYHVGLVEVGAPQSLLTDPAYSEFKESSVKGRTPLVYMHANDGMVHAFNTNNKDDAASKAVKGKEEWAFIPPNVLNFPRLIGTKLDSDGSFMDVKRSNPKYLLDGPLVAEDILLNGSYRTVLLGALGRAGTGLYALDVTVPESPLFLWSVENNCYDASEMLRSSENRLFMKWTGGTGTASSSLTTLASSSLSVPGRLRLTVSTPFIGTVDIENLSSLETKWIALLGAGAKRFPALEDDEGGKAVVALDMKDGSLVKEIVHDDLGAVVAPLSVEAGPRPMRIRKFYLGDDKGAVFEGDLSSYKKDEWGLGKVFAPGDSAPDSGLFTIPYALEVGNIRNRKWLFWGTGDPDLLFGGDKDGQCYVFAMNRSLAGDTAFTFDSLPQLVNVVGDQYDDTVAVSANGWRMHLGTGEMVTTPPVLYRGYIFFATYTAKADDPCSVGDSEFYIMKADTGLGGFVTFDQSGKENSWTKSVKLLATRISGITVTGGKVYVGVTSFSNASDPASALSGFTGNVSVNGTLLTFDVPENVMGNEEGGGDSPKMQPTYWRDWRP